ncbi:hypothetical protein RAS1_19920 [Phycisphaerae bacterium RAS1]|nr:hypothetical protein RAS1_19920 [Phycisphaerae bacterium RAS1]
MLRAAFFLVFVSTQSVGDVFVYECAQPPPEAGWQVVQIWCDPRQWIDAGWFNQHVELCPGYPPPGGQQGVYRRLLAELAGATDSYVEWRVETDAARSEIPWGGGAIIAAADDGSGYSFYIARDQAKLNRSNSLPIIFVDIVPGTPHTYRLEVRGAALYVWYVDGQVADSGVPVAAFPGANPEISWRAKAAWQANTTRWDYIRYGTIPADASGDYDSDGDVDESDLYFFSECLLGEGVPSGPGCRFADFDADGDTDCDDWVAFQAHWTGPPAVPPIPPPCAVVGDTNCDGAVNVLDINAFVMALSDPSAYAAQFPTCPISTADANGDGAIDILDINAFVTLLE